MNVLYAIFLTQMTRFRHKATVHYLPVYTPSQAEIEDAELFAFNVRKVI